MSTKRILLFVMGNWSHSNAALAAALQRQLPGWEVRRVDLLHEFKRDKRALISAVLDLPFLGWHALRGGGYDKTNILYSPVTSQALNSVARRLTAACEPAFTVQTTTRFNAATGLVPHFTVVDATLAAARQRYRDAFGSSERSLDLLDDFQRRVYDASTGVFALGEYVRRSLVRDYGVPPDRAFAIGAGPNIVLGERSKVLGSQDILFVGKDWVRKGGPVLLEAFRAIRAHHPQAVLNIVGDAPRLEEPGVKVVGTVPRDLLRNYFSKARIFALPSVFEAFGVAFVEALHFGLPIVGSSVGAVPEMVRDGINGFTFQPGDVERLSAALDRLLGCDKTALAFGEASYRLSRQFTWGRAARIMADHMLRLADCSPLGSPSPGRASRAVPIMS